VASVSTASAQTYRGFNYGSTFTNGSVKVQSDYQNEFFTAQNLVGIDSMLCFIAFGCISTLNEGEKEKLIAIHHISTSVIKFISNLTKFFAI